MTTCDDRPIRKLLVVGDLHAGSTLAPVAPGFRTIEGVQIKPSRLQDWLWRCWQDCCGWALVEMSEGPWGLILNGDMTEGTHHGTRQIWSNEHADHINCAVEILAPLAEHASKVYVVRGTECHTHSGEFGVGKALDAEVNPDTGNCGWDRLQMRVGSTEVAFAHHINATSRPYLEAGQYSIHLAVEQLEAAKQGQPIPRVVCRAHRHRFGQFRDATGLLVVGPPWQMATRFVHKAITASRARPGAYILDFTACDHADPMSLPAVRARTYETPEPTTIQL